MTISPQELKLLQESDVLKASTEDKERQELEAKIARLDLSRINLKVSPGIYDRLEKQAEFHKRSIEDHCIQVLVNQLETKIGQTFISSPSMLSNQQVTEKISAPSANSTVKRV